MSSPLMTILLRGKCCNSKHMMSMYGIRSKLLVQKMEMAKPQTQLTWNVNRGMQNWQVDTLRLMYRRGRDFDAVKQPPRHRSVWQDWNYTAEIFAFGKRLHEEFSEQNLRTAFTHRSYIEQEEKKQRDLGLQDVQLNLRDNSELAEAGEKIMLGYFKPYLRHFMPNVPEECITAVHQYLTSDNILATCAKYLGCTDLILCSDFPPTDTTMAKTLKAIVGAIEADHNTKRAERFALDFILTYIADKDILEIWDIPKPQVTLKKILERERLAEPEARLLRTSASGTIEACFVVGLYVNKQLIGSAPGETLAIAQEMAAHDALRRIFNLTVSATTFSYGEKAYNLDLSKSYMPHLTLNEWTPSLVKNNKKQLLDAISQ